MTNRLDGLADAGGPGRVDGDGTLPTALVEASTKSAGLTGKSAGTGTLGKALQVLDIVVNADEPLRFTEILSRVNQPRGTLHRQLSNLMDENLVSVNEDQCYTAGTRLLTLAARAWSQNTFKSLAEPHVRRLHEATQETVHLGLLDDIRVIYMDKLESRKTVRMHSQVGNVSPLYCTGVGKAMLAMLPAEERLQRVQRMEFVQHTAQTLHTPELLLGELEEIARIGIAHDREEHEPGIYCVAHAMIHHESRNVGGVSVTAPAYRMSPEIISSWEEQVRTCALNIQRDWADKLGPRATE